MSDDPNRLEIKVGSVVINAVGPLALRALLALAAMVLALVG